MAAMAVNVLAFLLAIFLWIVRHCKPTRLMLIKKTLTATHSKEFIEESTWKFRLFFSSGIFKRDKYYES